MPTIIEEIAAGKAVDLALKAVRGAWRAFAGQSDSLGRLLVLLHADFGKPSRLGRDVFYAWRNQGPLRIALEHALDGRLLASPETVAALADLIEPRLVRTGVQSRHDLAVQIARAVFVAVPVAVQGHDGTPLLARQLEEAREDREEGRTRRLPLQKAVVGVPRIVGSPARLIRARSGVLSYSARDDLLERMDAWMRSSSAFEVCVIGGRGGSGKTRLAVELCTRAENLGWRAGMLHGKVDASALDALLATRAPRLVVIDYAETRGEQVELIVVELGVHASQAHPVRVLLLVRARPGGEQDWAAALRQRSDALDVVLDDASGLALDDEPLGESDRNALFISAAGALAAHAAGPLQVPDAPDALSREVFATPLMVVIAAYLALHGDPDSLPTTRAALLDELLAHEARHWKATASARGLGVDAELQQRVVALSTLAGADNETQATEVLRLLDDLNDASTKQRGEIARWVRDLYPASGTFWHPLEPDLLGEHLVARTFTSQPAVLAGVLNSDSPAALIQPLELMTRAAPNYPALAGQLAAILTDQLSGLCGLAADQAADETDLDLLLGARTLAASLNRIVGVVDVESRALAAAAAHLPKRDNVVLSPLALSLTAGLTAYVRQLAAANPVEWYPDLASSLNNLSMRLRNAGRHDEALEAGTEATAAYRRLAARSPAEHEHDLARSLSNLSVLLGEMGRGAEGLPAISEAVGVVRRLHAADSKRFEPMLAQSLTNLSLRLADAGHHDDSMAASQEAIEGLRRLAITDPAYQADLALSLSNFAVVLNRAGRHEETATASQEALSIYRVLFSRSPADHAPQLIRALNHFSVGLAGVGRHEEGLAASEEAVALSRLLAAASPAVHEPDLAGALINLSNRLADAGIRDKALGASEEAVSIYRRLASVSPDVYLSTLADALRNLSVDLAAAGRQGEAHRVLLEAAEHESSA